MATNNSEILERLQRAKQKKEKKQPKPIPKVSAKKKAEIEENKEFAKLDKEFYLEIWAASPHKCYECGGGLGNVPHNFMFHHLLPKRIYPEFRHTPENIALVCLACHSKAETNIDFSPKIKALTEWAKKQLL
jgi:HNH endonuclease